DDKRGFYTGTETDRLALSPVAGRSTASAKPPAPGQAEQLADAVRLASCQPAVGAIFNFELADEPDLAGWQSGVLWADGTPKPSYTALRTVVRDVATDSVDCAKFATTAVPPRLASRPPSSPFVVSDLRISAISSFSATIDWR